MSRVKGDRSVCMSGFSSVWITTYSISVNLEFDIETSSRTIKLGIVVDFVFNGALQWNVCMQSTVLVIVSVLMKIISYAARLNKKALKNLPRTQLQQRRKQYFVVEYFMVFAVHRHRIDHWRLTEAEKVAINILSFSPKKHCPISSYFCIREPW